MGRWALLIAAMLVAAFVAAAGFVVIRHDQPQQEWPRHDWRVEYQMGRIHEGKNSAWSIVKGQAKNETPDWGAVQEPVIGFVEMSELLKTSKSVEIRQSADGYVAAVTGIVDAVTRQDAEAFRQSLGSLETSCHDCHFDGGVGGKLRGE